VHLHGTGDELVAAFDRWAAEQRAADAAASRAKERSLRDQAQGSATWTGFLVDLAEAEDTVTLAIAGRRRSGRVVGVGADFLVLEQGNGRPALVARDAVSALWPERSAALASGDRPPRLDLDLAAALSLLAEDCQPLAVTVGDGEEVVGDLVSVGEDVCSLRSPAPARRVCHLPLAAVRVCELR
jgi:hypothetical protein